MEAAREVHLIAKKAKEQKGNSLEPWEIQHLAAVCLMDVQPCHVDPSTDRKVLFAHLHPRTDRNRFDNRRREVEWVFGVRIEVVSVDGSRWQQKQRSMTA